MGEDAAALINKRLDEMEKKIIAVVKQELTKEKIEVKRYNKKLHNSKLLLRNYKRFQTHCTESQFTATQLIDSELIEMIKDADNIDDNNIYIESILRTKERTAIMLNHIKRVLDFYMYTAESSEQEPYRRRAKVIKYKYIDGKGNEEIAARLNIHTRTVDKDIDKAIAEISPLLFGIDGIKLE